MGTKVTSRISKANPRSKMRFIWVYIVVRDEETVGQQLPKDEDQYQKSANFTKIVKATAPILPLFSHLT
jgi:hypothetical protein